MHHNYFTVLTLYNLFISTEDLQHILSITCKKIMHTAMAMIHTVMLLLHVIQLDLLSLSSYNCIIGQCGKRKTKHRTKNP